MLGVALEFQKMRRRKVWLILLALLSVQFLWSLIAYFRMAPTRQLLENGWLSCLNQFALLDAIIMPFFTAILASRLCDIEHKGQTLKLLETVQPASRLFSAKFLFGALHLAAASFLQVGMLLIIGKTRGFLGTPPAKLFALQLLFPFCVSLAAYLLQLILSLMIQNQVVPMAVGLFASFIGLFSMFFPKAVMRLVLWSYFAVLSPIEMQYDAQTRVTNYIIVNPDWGAFAVIIGTLIILYILGCTLFDRKEI